MNLSSLILPLLLASAAVYGMGKRVNVYAALTRGAEEGLTVLLHIIPALVGLLTAVSMFRASGAMELLTRLWAPALEFLGIPPETVPLMLIRPVSGSGAVAVAGDRMAASGPARRLGRTAAGGAGGGSHRLSHCRPVRPALFRCLTPNVLTAAPSYRRREINRFMEKHRGRILTDAPPALCLFLSFLCCPAGYPAASKSSASLYSCLTV